MGERLTAEALAAIRGRHERMLRNHGGQFHPISTLAVYRDRAALLRHVEALEGEVKFWSGAAGESALREVANRETAEARLARLVEGLETHIEVCVVNDWHLDIARVKSLINEAAGEGK